MGCCWVGRSEAGSEVWWLLALRPDFDERAVECRWELVGLAGVFVRRLVVSSSEEGRDGWEGEGNWVDILGYDCLRDCPCAWEARLEEAGSVHGLSGHGS